MSQQSNSSSSENLSLHNESWWALLLWVCSSWESELLKEPVMSPQLQQASSIPMLFSQHCMWRVLEDVNQKRILLSCPHPLESSVYPLVNWVHSVYQGHENNQGTVPIPAACTSLRASPVSWGWQRWFQQWCCFLRARGIKSDTRNQILTSSLSGSLLIPVQMGVLLQFGIVLASILCETKELPGGQWRFLMRASARRKTEKYPLAINGDVCAVFLLQLH